MTKASQPGGWPCLPAQHCARCPVSTEGFRVAGHDAMPNTRPRCLQTSCPSARRHRQQAPSTLSSSHPIGPGRPGRTCTTGTSSPAPRAAAARAGHPRQEHRQHRGTGHPAHRAPRGTEGAPSTRGTEHHGTTPEPHPNPPHRTIGHTIPKGWKTIPKAHFPGHRQLWRLPSGLRIT
ncbi:MAG: hypothetical protein QOF30_713 [Acidimicrobiaceae bacterium]|nr:hypothetical protein [Acidimicrobiaceae bacterium]